MAGDPDTITGLLFNLTDLKMILEDKIVTWLDHQDLNKLPEFAHLVPTSENLARVIWSRLVIVPFLPARLYEIELKETSNNSVSYRGEGEPL